MFKNLKLGSKLMLGFSSVALITLILGVIGYYGAVKNSEAINEIGSVRLPGVQASLDMECQIGLVIRYIRNLLIPGLTREEYERQYVQITEARKEYRKAFSIYEALPHTPEESVEWESFIKIIPEWMKINDRIIELRRDVDATGIFNPDKLLSQLR